MKRSGPLRRGKPLRRKSEKTAARDAEYSTRRYDFLCRHAWCLGGKLLGLRGCTKWATDVHHTKGRVGSLMLDERHWAQMCRTCHQWVTEHPADNRRLISLMEEICLPSNTESKEPLSDD